MLILTAKGTIKKDNREDFINMAQELITETKKEEGCISYDLYEDINDKNIITFIEAWSSKEAIEKHKNTNHFTRIAPMLDKFRETEAKVNIYEKIENR